MSRRPEHGPAPADLAPPRTWYVRAKGGLDYSLALVMLIPAAPVILLLAALVKLTSPGPAFYAQTRLGKNGRPYRLYKLRSMSQDAEKLSGPQWSTPGDPRVTRLGRFLRRSHLDELPQLWNVLKGDMSLVGPRPERPEFVVPLGQAIPHYRDRLAVRPGITGLAQIQLPPDSDLDSVRRKVAYDLYYMRRGTFWLDVRILLITGLHLIGIPCGPACAVLRLPGGDTVENDYKGRSEQTILLAEVQLT